MQYFTEQWSLEIWMKVRHMTVPAQSGCNCDHYRMSGRAPRPPCAHHPPEVRHLPPHHGRQPQPHRDRQRKLSEKWEYLEIMREIMFVYLEISFVWQFALTDWLMINYIQRCLTP